MSAILFAMQRDTDELIATARTSLARLRRATSDLRHATEESSRSRLRRYREREARDAQSRASIDDAR
jgi:hypothetical protein